MCHDLYNYENLFYILIICFHISTLLRWLACVKKKGPKKTFDFQNHRIIYYIFLFSKELFKQQVYDGNEPKNVCLLLVILLTLMVQIRAYLKVLMFLFIVNDTLDDILGESGDEEESDAVVSQVLDEIGIEITGKVKLSPTFVKISIIFFICFYTFS